MQPKKYLADSHILRQIHQATQTILKRFSNIQAPKDFVDTEAGQERLDPICILLIAIGESLKNLDKVTLHRFLPCYPQIDWKKLKQSEMLLAITTLILIMKSFTLFAKNICH